MLLLQESTEVKQCGCEACPFGHRRACVLVKAGGDSTMKRTEIRERMEEAHNRLLRAIDGLTETEATRKGLNPQWSVKDCLAHIAAWEAVGVGIIGDIAKGTWKPQEIDREFINGFNARAVEERTMRSMREVADEYNGVHAQMEQAIAALPDEVDDASPAFHLVELLTAKHPTHHAAQIEEWKKTVMNAE